jgi:MFS family permease
VLQSLIAYWLYTRFDMGLVALGWTFFGAQILSGLSLLLAARLAPRLGLVNTMVFSHLISNVLLIGVALAPSAALAVTLLLARHLLSQMDVPTRQSFLMLAVQDHEREGAASLTNVSRTLAQSISPALSGWVIATGSLAAPFLQAGPEDRLRPDALRDDPPPGDAMTLILTRGDVVALLTLDACIAAVEQAFALQGESRALGPGILGLHVPDGGFHVKAAGLPLSRLYVAVKVNANFPENGRRRGLPTIQGVLALSDGESGRPLALMDSMEITVLRTGAATAVAARHLARPDARTATIVGCGRQGRIQLAALARVRPLERAYAVDTAAAVARRFATETSAQLGLDVRPAGSAAEAAPLSDICVTCTPSRHPLLRREDIAAGPSTPRSAPTARTRSRSIRR